MEEPSTPSVSTWDALRAFGFHPDPSVVSDPPGGLSYQVAGFKLAASVCNDFRTGPTILFTGVYSKGRIVEVQFEVPRDLGSAETVAAWVAGSLDRTLGPGFEEPEIHPWLAIGRRNQDLTPWESRRVSHSLRPRCSVDSDWMKLLLRDLGRALKRLDPPAEVRFGFDGTTLIVHASGFRAAVPADGQPWPQAVEVSAQVLGELPSRVSRPLVWIECYGDHLRIMNRAYRLKGPKTE